MQPQAGPDRAALPASNGAVRSSAPAARDWPAKRASAVGALLVVGLLVAYCLVLVSSMRQIERTRNADASLQRDRLACERLANPRLRADCSRALTTGGAATTLLSLP